MKSFFKRLRNAAQSTPQKAEKRGLILDRLEDRSLFDAAAMLDADALENSISSNSDDALNPVQSQDHLLAQQDDVNRHRIERIVRPESYRQVAFVDAGVRGYDALIRDLESNGIDVHLLSADQDGLEQVADMLANYQEIDAIHIVSHGQQGELLLGNARIGIEEIHSTYAESLERLGKSLSDDGDILIYGCELAETAHGRELLNSISQLTGADVAASDDLTGHADQGGDWELEFATGTISAAIPFSRSVIAGWQGVLAPQEFYIPMTESDIYDALEIIFEEGTFGPVQQDIVTTVGITATQDGTVIYWDHHEDGFEATQTGTANARYFGLG